MPIYFAGCTSSILFEYKGNNEDQLIAPFSEIIHPELTDIEIGCTYLLLWQSERLFISYDPERMSGSRVMLVELPNPSTAGSCKLVVPHHQRERISILSTNNVLWEYDINENVWEMINVFRPNSDEYAVKIIHCGFNMLLTNLGRLLTMHDHQEITKHNVKFIDIAGINGINNVVKHVFLLGNDGNIYAITVGMHQSENGNMVPGRIFGPDILPVLLQPKFVQIAGGTEHFAAITEEGQLYTWGCNIHGELGFNYYGNYAFIPLLVSFQYHNAYIQVKVKKVGCGSHFTICLADDGVLWCAGDNSCGQFGMRTANTSYPKFMRLAIGSLSGNTLKDFKCNEKGTAIIAEGYYYFYDMY